LEVEWFEKALSLKEKEKNKRWHQQTIRESRSLMGLRDMIGLTLQRR